VLSLAAKFSIVDPFFNKKKQESLPIFVAPRDQSISLSKAGIFLQISYIFSCRICAACSFPPAVLNNLAPGYKIARINKIKTDKNDLEYARGKTAYTYLYLIAILKKTL
jgi:hypothetical protein